jgi:hypothetical protein
VKRLGWLAFLVGCGFQGTSPSAAIDGSTPPPVDASVPADTPVTPPPIDARQCFGVGLLKLCLMAPPAGDRMLPSAINTDAAGTCTQVFPQTGSPTAAPELCVIAARTITAQGTVTVTGARALVLIAADTIAVASGAALDASSTTNPKHPGPGANLGACAKPGNGDSSNNGAGGGAGGSLATKGGNGGLGNKNAPGGKQNGAKGGTAGVAQPPPTLLRGGCPGGDGGDGQPGNGGAGGSGGGAVYLIAGGSITITGDVFASGAGGDATPNNAGRQQGGGGGGSGGMIGLDAPVVTIDGRVVANGAAGGGGGATTGGKSGGEGTTMTWDVRAAAGGAGTGCNGTVTGGAPGTAKDNTDNIDGAEADCGAGGGGGGLGVVTIYGTVTRGTMISPPPITH